MSTPAEPSKYLSSQATVVITVMPDRTVVIRADNNGRNAAAQLADAVAELAYQVLAGNISASPVPSAAAGKEGT